MPLTICPRCGHDNPNAPLYCSNCGVDIEEASLQCARSLVNCPNCRSIVQSDAFCSRCGTTLSIPTQSEPFTPVIQKPLTICPRCGHDNPDAPLFCSNCGVDIEEALLHSARSQVNCPNCRSMVQSDAFCSRCGTTLPVPSQSQPSSAVIQKPSQGIWTKLTSNQRAGLGCLGLFLVVMIVMSISRSDRNAASNQQSTSSSPPLSTAPPKPSPEIHAAVRFTGTQFVITNKDSFDWTNVKLEINGGIFSGGYQLKSERMKAGETYTVGALQFADSDGKRFNPYQMKPQKFSMFADTPNGMAAYGGVWD